MTDTIKLNQIRDNEGAAKKLTRVGRGNGSGKGKTAGRGQKGQNSRGSGKVRIGFEGGQNPLYRRLPMRGFNNKNFTTTYTVVNVGTLQQMVDDGRLDPKGKVTIDSIIQAGLTKKPHDGLKVLGNGELKTKLNIEAAAASASAVKAVEKAGGKLDVLPQKEPTGRLEPKAKAKTAK